MSKRGGVVILSKSPFNLRGRQAILAGVICVAAALVMPLPAAVARVKCNQKTLPKLMKNEGFVAPANFKAVVLKVKFNNARNKVVSWTAYDYNGTSDDRTWNAASSIKFMAAIGALQRTRSLGFGPSAEVTFRGRKKAVTTVKKLVEDAIIDSNNIAYNRLVQLAGFDRLHSKVLVPRYGIADTSLMKAYQQGDWTAAGESIQLREAPEIQLRQGKKKRTIPASVGKVKRNCHSSVCTDLRDIAEAVMTLMIQEQVPAGRSFGLHRTDLNLVRKAMMEDRSRGNEFVDNLRRGLDLKQARFFSKPGYSENWYSSVSYIFIKGRPEAWVVAMAGKPDRDALNSAAKIVGKLIRNKRL